MNSDQDKAREDFLEIKDLLKRGITDFENGNRVVYRDLANYLGQLVIDASGEKSLFRRLYPKIKFHPLNGIDFEETLRDMGLLSNLVFLSKGEIGINPKGLDSYNLFDFDGKPISLNGWLNQNVIYIGNPITLQEVIRSVRNKIGSHSDPKFNSVLKKTRSTYYGDVRSEVSIVYGTARYLHHIMCEIVKNKLFLTTPELNNS